MKFIAAIYFISWGFLTAAASESADLSDRKRKSSCSLFTLCSVWERNSDYSWSTCCTDAVRGPIYRVHNVRFSSIFLLLLHWQNRNKTTDLLWVFTSLNVVLWYRLMYVLVIFQVLHFPPTVQNITLSYMDTLHWPCIWMWVFVVFIFDYLNLLICILCVFVCILCMFMHTCVCYLK